VPPIQAPIPDFRGLAVKTVLQRGSDGGPDSRWAHKIFFQARKAAGLRNLGPTSITAAHITFARRHHCLPPPLISCSVFASPRRRRLVRSLTCCNPMASLTLGRLLRCRLVAPPTASGLPGRSRLSRPRHIIDPSSCQLLGSRKGLLYPAKTYCLPVVPNISNKFLDVLGNR
jgi:hypothetical protein